jgi:hypothetical protein
MPVTHRGKGGGADQSIHGRLELGAACKGETLMFRSRALEEENYVCGLRKTSCLIVWTLQSHHGLIFLKKAVNSGNKAPLSHASIIPEEAVRLLRYNYEECLLHAGLLLGLFLDTEDGDDRFFRNFG